MAGLQTEYIIRLAHKLVDVSKVKLRHQNALTYPLRKQFFIDRVMEKAEQKTLNEDSYHIMCELESFIKEMVAIMKTRRSDTGEKKIQDRERNQLNDNKIIKMYKKDETYRKRHRENVRI